jgi:hypothetical protein
VKWLARSELFQSSSIYYTIGMDLNSERAMVSDDQSLIEVLKPTLGGGGGKLRE